MGGLLVPQRLLVKGRGDVVRALRCHVRDALAN
jgi:hypothetical protein